MIENVGESVINHFEDIAWKTTRRNVRESLTLYLRNKAIHPHTFDVINIGMNLLFLIILNHKER
jgi:hypothetical protein